MRLILIGGGEHARVVADAARGAWTIVGFIDPKAHVELQALGVAWLGDDAAAIADPDASYVLAIGGVADTAVRRRVARAYADVRWATVVHDRAVVSPHARLAPGAAVMAGAVVQSGASIGAHAIVNTGAIVEHDVIVDDHAHVGPGAVIGGGAVIGVGAYIGLGARVRDHIRIGAGAVVGMGSVVVASVGDGETVLGVPARRRG